MKNKPLISIIIVIYNNENYIKTLFESVMKQEYQEIELIFVDNNSVDNSVKLISQFTKLYKNKLKTKLLKLNSNTGFAYANNHGITNSSGKYILFMNSDITLEKNSIKELVLLIEKKSKINCIGVAPKMYLTKFLPEKVFDSVGICIDYNGSPYNRGIGQSDFGQYDNIDRILGCCFGCALVNKEIYLKLGGLDNSYFAYFEDVDFCLRARKSGYEFYSCPKAVVYHNHSGSSSKNSYGWKHYLIFRNYLRTVIKSYGKKSSLRIFLIKIKDLIHTSFDINQNKEIRISSFKVLLNFIFRDFWIYSMLRKRYQKNYIKEITDEFLFSFSHNEPAHFFDPVNYEPINKIEMYQYVLSRLVEQKLLNRINHKVVEEFIKSYYCVSKERRKVSLSKMFKTRSDNNFL